MLMIKSFQSSFKLNCEISGVLASHIKVYDAFLVKLILRILGCYLDKTIHLKISLWFLEKYNEHFTSFKLNKVFAEIVVQDLRKSPKNQHVNVGQVPKVFM